MICKCGCKLESTNKTTIFNCKTCVEIEEIQVRNIEGFNNKDIRKVYKDNLNRLYTKTYENELVDIEIKNELVVFSDNEIRRIREYLQNSFYCKHCGYREEKDKWLYLEPEVIYDETGVEELTYIVNRVKCKYCECTMEIINGKDNI